MQSNFTLRPALRLFWTLSITVILSALSCKQFTSYAQSDLCSQPPITLSSSHLTDGFQVKDSTCVIILVAGTPTGYCQSNCDATIKDHYGLTIIWSNTWNCNSGPTPNPQYVCINPGGKFDFYSNYLCPGITVTASCAAKPNANCPSPCQ